MDNEVELTLLYKESKSGAFVGFIKEIPGVVSQGSTYDKLVANIKNALSGYIKVLTDHKEKLMNE